MCCMSVVIRQGLGGICLALVALAAGLALRSASEALSEILLFAALVTALVSLGSMAWELLRSE